MPGVKIPAHTPPPRAYETGANAGGIPFDAAVVWYAERGTIRHSCCRSPPPKASINAPASGILDSRNTPNTRAEITLGIDFSPWIDDRDVW